MSKTTTTKKTPAAKRGEIGRTMTGSEILVAALPGRRRDSEFLSSRATTTPGCKLTQAEKAENRLTEIASAGLTGAIQMQELGTCGAFPRLGLPRIEAPRLNCLPADPVSVAHDVRPLAPASATIRDASAVVRIGSVTIPEASGMIRNGSAVIPDASAMIRNGSAAVRDGSVTIPGASAMIRNGSAPLPNGTTVVIPVTCAVSRLDPARRPIPAAPNRVFRSNQPRTDKTHERHKHRRTASR